MAYDEKLAESVNNVLDELEIPVWQARKMFGGVGFMVGGNMACGVLNDELIVRVGLADYEDALAQADTRVFDTTGRVMKGWVMVSGNGLSEHEAFRGWVSQGVNFALTLPPK